LAFRPEAIILTGSEVRERKGLTSMSIDRSLRLKSSLARHRNVLTRSERIATMQTREVWKDSMSALGLPKLGNRKPKAGKKAAKKEEAGAEGAAAAPAAASAKPAAGKPAAKPAAKPATKGK